MDVTKLVGSSWSKHIKDEFDKPYIKSLMEFITRERKNHTVFPSRDDVFNAFKLTPYDNVKVIILGQDPYFNEGQAHGLAFSVKEEPIKFPPSLKNIISEIENNFGFSLYGEHNLTFLAEQGVFLLNRILTVRKGQPLSHAGRGWETFTERVIKELNERFQPTVFMLWGREAQKVEPLIDQSFHLVLKTSHPSPLSVNQGFKGCGHFWKANDFLTKYGINPISWTKTG